MVKQNKQGNQPTAKEGRKGLSLIKLRTKYVFKQSEILEIDCLGICDMDTLSPKAKRKVAAAQVISHNLRCGQFKTG